MTKESFDQISEFNKLTMDVSKRTAEYMIGTTNKCLVDIAQGFGEIARIKKVEDWMSIQTQLASEMSNKVMKSSQEAFHIWKENSNDINHFMEACTKSFQGVWPMKSARGKI